MTNFLRKLQEKMAPSIVPERDDLLRRLSGAQIRLSEVSQRLTELEAERDAVTLDREYRHINRMLHHYPVRVSGGPGTVIENSLDDDDELVSRVANSYRKAIQTPVGPKKSMWLEQFAAANASTHATLTKGSGSEIARMLRNPAGSMLFYGFDSIQSEDVPKNDNVIWTAWNHRLVYDNLLQLSVAVGTRRMENPEASAVIQDSPDAEELLDKLDDALGFRIEFPNIFAGETGLATSRGVANYRAVQAVYQAWRIRAIVRELRNPRVLEIGAGLGRTAYYATKMGISDYTIIDIPMTGVAQGYFLGRVLGQEEVTLWGEEQSGRLRILPPAAYVNNEDKFDLIVNIDSLTEMARETAEQYIDGASRKTSRFFSINHEHNPFTVSELLRSRDDISVWRGPCWSRRGYVEELVEFKRRRVD